MTETTTDPGWTCSHPSHVQQVGDSWGAWFALSGLSKDDLATRATEVLTAWAGAGCGAGFHQALLMDVRDPGVAPSPSVSAVKLSCPAGDPAAHVLHWQEAAPENGAWPLRETLLQDLGSPLTDATVSRIVLSRRLDSITREQFGEHWLTQHAPLVLSQGPGFSRYSVGPVADDGEPFDGIAEQRFDSQAQWTEHDRQVFESKPEVRADIPRFIGGGQQLAATGQLTICHTS